MRKFKIGDKVILREPSNSFPDIPGEVVYVNNYLVYVRWSGWGRGLSGPEYGLRFPARDFWAFPPGHLTKLDPVRGWLVCFLVSYFALTMLVLFHWLQSVGILP